MSALYMINFTLDREFHSGNISCRNLSEYMLKQFNNQWNGMEWKGISNLRMLRTRRNEYKILSWANITGTSSVTLKLRNKEDCFKSLKIQLVVLIIAERTYQITLLNLFPIPASPGCRGTQPSPGTYCGVWMHAVARRALGAQRRSWQKGHHHAPLSVMSPCNRPPCSTWVHWWRRILPVRTLFGHQQKFIQSYGWFHEQLANPEIFIFMSCSNSKFQINPLDSWSHCSSLFSPQPNVYLLCYLLSWTLSSYVSPTHLTQVW